MMSSHSLKDKQSKNYFLEYVLIGISTVLLGIWAVKNTIALRNGLLIMGSILSMIFIYRENKDSHLIKNISFKDLFPLLLLAFFILWVIGHFLFLSRYPDIQYKELTSTWLRSLLSAILGIGVGLVVRKNPKIISMMWMGIFASFIFLICQYIPRAISLNNLYAPDWYGGSYIYIGKINAVLVGSILFAGILGVMVDYLINFGPSKSLTQITTFIFCFILIEYIYVFILDSRNGTGISALLIFFWGFVGFIWAISNQRFRKKILDAKNLKKVIPTFFLLFYVFSWFAIQQSHHNKGWRIMWDEAKLGVQIEKFPQWQNVELYGHPTLEDGSPIIGNTYERVAYATAGLMLIPQNPMGAGVLNKPFTRLLTKNYPLATHPPSTHSAWIEFTLAFGLPGIFLLFGSLCSLFYLSYTSPPSLLYGSSITLCLMVGIVYTFGEVSTQHGVEILFFLICFISAMRIPVVKCSRAQ